MKRLICALALAVFVVGAADGQEKPKAKETPKVIAGHCHCGKVKYEVKGRIVGQSYCDCRACQLASGGLKGAFVTVLESTFKITGEVKTFRSDSKVKCDANGVWNFCPTCGTTVFWKPHRGDKVDLFAGTLDDTTLFTVKDK